MYLAAVVAGSESVMALMSGYLYRALLAAGAPDELARKAAEEVASHERAFNEGRCGTTVLTWMVGFNLALTIAIGVKVLFPGL